MFQNQERFYNEMKGNIVDLSIDGLNTCIFKELERIEISNKAIKMDTIIKDKLAELRGDFWNIFPPHKNKL